MSILFKELPIKETIKEALEGLGFEVPTPIQEQSIPLVLDGLDIIGQAQTGTGKTFAFAIPMIEKINVSESSIQGLILTPTRELTTQVYKEILKLIKYEPKIKVTTIVGGESYDKQFKELAKKPHIIVATPGRIIDHINRGTIDLSKVKLLTLDEADEMLNMGFQEDIEIILKTTPKERQTVLFSATIPPFIKKVAKMYQNNPEIVKIDAKELTVDKIEQGYFIVKEEDKPNLLVRLLDLEQPKTAIIFANTKKDVDQIAETLQHNKYMADALHGDLKQSQRNYVMTRFRNKQLNLLIATDVAARGLDINDVELVINYDLPTQDEVYVHRVGRTGRAGKKGKAYSFVSPRKRGMIEFLEKFIKREIKFLDVPTEEQIYKSQTKTFKNQLKSAMSQIETIDLSLVNDLLIDETSKDKLIYALLQDRMPVQKNYAPIEIYQKYSKSKSNNQKNNSKFDRNNKNKSNNGKYVELLINLGKEDSMNPQKLFKILEKDYGIFSRNIGDIQHYKNETKFELKVEQLKRINLNKRIQIGKKQVLIKKI
ncbi:DEAD/DEAH box helicase [Acholeplasma equifetale]|uniref:DEAD/DEAH box helicase n=1 Tax=Acholeplasma equifetale TaxID=264634 RepID=UPI00047A2551|nr:DEAD/DEAH box helicase [Acholeplasma equifetale]